MKQNIDRNEVFKKLVKIIHENLVGFETAELKDDTVINNETGVDSMTFIYVMCKIESEFNIKIPTKKWTKLQTFGDVVDAAIKELSR